MDRYPLTLTPANRQRAHAWVDRAVKVGGMVLEVREAKRTDDQNSALWGLLAQIAKQRPTHNGVKMTAELWKCVFMQALGMEMTFLPTLDGTGMFPMGLRSSKLTKGEFSDLLELILAWCASEGLAVEHFDEAAA